MAVYEALLLNTVVPQIQAAQAGDSYVMVVNATTPALRITQTGTGNALEVEDSANPDATPFVVTAAGDVGVGTNAPAYKLAVIGGTTVASFNGSGARTGYIYAGSQYVGFGDSANLAGSQIYIDSTNNAIGLQIANSVKATLDASGNLGLGVTPSAWSDFTGFQVGGLGAANIGGLSNNVFFASNAYYGSGQFRYAAAASTVATIYRQTAGQHIWINAAAGTAGNVITPIQAMTLDAIGNLLVGKTSESQSVAGVQIRGDAVGLIEITRTADNALTLRRNDSDGTIQTFRRDGTTVGTISVTTTATAYNTSSDYRLKDNSQPLQNSGAFVDALQPKTWTWKADGSKGVGFIAHEVQEVSPGSVVGTKDAVDADGKPVMQAMEYGSAEFIANIVAELQSLRARVAQLEAKQ